MNIDYTVQIWREGDQCIAHAMPLNVASSGATPDDARHAVDEAVRGFLATCAEMGTLEEVLEEAGYRRGADGNWACPQWVAIERREAPVAA